MAEDASAYDGSTHEQIGHYADHHILSRAHINCLQPLLGQQPDKPNRNTHLQSQGSDQLQLVTTILTKVSDAVFSVQHCKGRESTFALITMWYLDPLLMTSS